MTEILTEPFVHPAAWKSADMNTNKGWIYELNSHEVKELKDAVNFVSGNKTPLRELTAESFPLSQLKKRIGALRDELEDGRGFELWRGLPLADWTLDELKIAFWGLGQHLGKPVVQNSRGELLGHVINTTSTDPDTNADSRFYHTNHAAPFHVDGADVVALACVRRAKEGGASLVVSSCSIYNAILEKRPDLIPLLYEPLWFDHRGERSPITGNPYWVTSISGWVNGKLSMMYLRNFIESAQRYDGAPPLTRQHEELFDLIDELAASSELCLSMDFKPGDIQWLNNHTTLHSRTSYTDWDDPEKRRWLLRLWLNFNERQRFTETYGFYGIAIDDATI